MELPIGVAATDTPVPTVPCATVFQPSQVGMINCWLVSAMSSCSGAVHAATEHASSSGAQCAIRFMIATFLKRSLITCREFVAHRCIGHAAPECVASSRIREPPVCGGDGS